MLVTLTYIVDLKKYVNINEKITRKEKRTINTLLAPKKIVLKTKPGEMR